MVGGFVIVRFFGNGFGRSINETIKTLAWKFSC